MKLVATGGLGLATRLQAVPSQCRILSHAATQLRTGKRAESVLAEIREQNPEMLRDYCDLQVTLTPPLRPVPRAVASA